MYIPASHQLRVASRLRMVNLTSHNKTKKLPRLILAFVFLLNGLSFGSIADWFYSSDRDKTHQSYTQNNYAYRDTFSNFLPSTLGLFSITPQKDFLYGAFTKDTARMWEMNGTLSHDLKTYVAPDINASDYGSVKLHLRQAGHSSWFHRIFSTYGASAVNSEIPKFTVWEQHSFVSGMYEPQKFSNVQMSGNAYKSFDVATARDNWIVRERADNITYDAANRPTSMILHTYDIAGNVFAQKMDNIVYAQSADAGRRQTMLADAESKIEKTEYYGHRQIYDGLSETLDPAKYVPASFNLTTRDPRGNTTNIAFTNVQWKNDAVIGFDAAITRNGIATTVHATPVFSNEGQRIGVTVKVTDTAGTHAFAWKADDQVAFKDFAKQVMQGVNPLDIMGSSRVQMGEVKVAWLAQGYDKFGLLDNSTKGLVIDEAQRNVKTSAIDTFIAKAKNFRDKISGDNISAEAYKDRIQRNYGIMVEDGQTKWSKTELKMLYSVLQSLPKVYDGKTTLQCIKREGVYKDDYDMPDTNTMGLYRSWEKRIYIFDSAHTVSNMKNSTQEFKATIIHELTHAIQYADPSIKGGYYTNAWNNPLIKNYARVTGWNSSRAFDYSGDINKIPTAYGQFNVKEDMCESAKIYVLDPNRLKQCSLERYTFLRKNIFNGREY